MPQLRLSYFDFEGGRGEAARLALSMGDIAFEDHRIPVPSWATVREAMPFHALPVLEVDGEAITQSNAINRYVGRLAGLYPEDALDALRCDEIMDAVEDVTTQVVATFGMEDAHALRTTREALVGGPIRLYLERLQDILVARGGAYFAAKRLTVADLKVYVWVRNLRSGILEHIPKDLVDRVAPALAEHSDRVEADPRIAAYQTGRR